MGMMRSISSQKPVSCHSRAAASAKKVANSGRLEYLMSRKSLPAQKRSGFLNSGIPDEVLLSLVAPQQMLLGTRQGLHAGFTNTHIAPQQPFA